MLCGGGNGQQDFLLSIFGHFGAVYLRRRQNAIGEGRSAAEGEPSRQIVTERRPGSLHRCFQAAATAELAQAAAFFNPGMGKLGEARPLAVNLLRFFRGHLGLESPGRRGFLQA